MLQVRCCGTPFEIGGQHGREAKAKVHGSLAFYKDLFHKTCALDWDAVRREATDFVAPLEQDHPRYLEEIRGVADGAGVDFVDILALNVRTEITFGLFTDDGKPNIKLDGCTSLAYKTKPDESFLAQNWDWQVEQLPNIFICHISQPGSGIPDFSMVTEGGVIGKIGLNECGVGVCLNAIRARGIDKSRLPIHLALRTALESPSRGVAVERLVTSGVAGSAHILVGDGAGSIGLECTSVGVKKLEMDQDGVIVHSNHLLLDHPDVDEPPWLQDSPGRLTTMRKLITRSIPAASNVDMQTFAPLFEDEEQYPNGINRHQVQDSEVETLFTIIMDLAKKKANVTFGRPTHQTGHAELVF